MQGKYNKVQGKYNKVQGKTKSLLRLALCLIFDLPYTSYLPYLIRPICPTLYVLFDLPYTSYLPYLIPYSLPCTSLCSPSRVQVVASHRNRQVLYRDARQSKVGCQLIRVLFLFANLPPVTAVPAVRRARVLFLFANLPPVTAVPATHTASLHCCLLSIWCNR